MTEEPEYGELVSFRRGLVEIIGTVAEIYGPENNRRVVVNLHPDISGETVDEPTTMALSVDDVERVVPA